jgi:asparagine synthase (glutamine-hydrolysing)
MCGIWASFRILPPKQAIDIVAHRGPDGHGWQSFDTPYGNITLAHRRLAILDVRDIANQPMSYCNQRYWITFNGVIYNYLDLKKELKEKEYLFRTNSDTEVLLAAYAHWGINCLEKLKGMFAFVIYDKLNQTLFIASDRFGIKPLYYYQSNEGIAFASEIKQFITLQHFKPTINTSTTIDFLYYGLINHDNNTLFSQIKKIQGGKYCFIDIKSWNYNSNLILKDWYNLSHIVATRKIDCIDHEENFYELFHNAVKSHLLSDVPIGVCLSGGLDSSAIVSMIANLTSNKNLHTFSSVFTDPKMNESSFIESVVTKYNVKSTLLSPQPQDLLKDLEKICWHQDLPFTSTSIYAQWKVFETAKYHGVKVMLDGQGADEQLAGYHSMFGAFLASLFLNKKIKLVFQELLKINRKHQMEVIKLLSLFLFQLMPYHMAAHFIRIVRKNHKVPWLHNKCYSLLSSQNTPYKSHCSRIEDPLQALSVHLILHTSLPMLLHFEDRNSMAHGIEARVPFVDHQLVEFSLLLKPELKVKNGTTKQILRKSLQQILPTLIYNRQDKLGFPTPEAAWLRGTLNTLGKQGIGIAYERFYPLFQKKTLTAWSQAILNGQKKYDFALWRIICLGYWAKVFDLSHDTLV